VALKLDVLHLKPLALIVLGRWTYLNNIYYDQQNNIKFKHEKTRTMRIFFRIINDFVHRFILDRTFVDFTVSLLILPFYIVDFNSETVKSTI
jgi:hypothetical protein